LPTLPATTAKAKEHLMSDLMKCRAARLLRLAG
jgi:hypothetical protein